MAPPNLSIDEIFNAAAELSDPAERAAFLDRACAGDDQLRTEVEDLLRHDSAAGSFLQAADPSCCGPRPTPELIEGPGTVIGPYKLLEQIGEGGFGVVFMAEQERPVRRRVALKVIKPGMDTRQVIARFEAERQALALMDHSSIAKVLDAGATGTGRPFFVMELVRGVPITEFCDQAQLTPRERLELFVTVCQAVQHAHQKGIIHRDIKPTNVLVTKHDDRPVVKVIDFGVAKATSGQLTDKTLFTGFAQVVGTPLYMSPEQAALSAIDVDTRSDIYSLGVLLYELLTGTTPFDKARLQQASFDEVRRIIREEEPLKPSTRISTLGDAASTVAEHRRIDARRLVQVVRGDLDWIVMKCLEKDRTRRYETASGVIRDIERYLNEEPVDARPPSTTYKFCKFARRNRAPLITAAVVLCTAVTGLAVSTALIAQQRDAARQAARGEGRAAAEARKQQAEAQRQSRLARQKADEAEAERQRAEENLRKAREGVDRMITRVAEGLTNEPHMEQIRRALLEDALEFYKGFLEQKSSDPVIRHETARAYLRVAWIYMLVGRGSESYDPLRHAVGLLEQLSTEFPAVPEYRDDLALAHDRLAMQHSYQLRPSGDVIADRRKELAVREKLVTDFPAVPDYRDNLAYCYSNLGNVLGSVGRLDEAEKQFRQALAVLHKRESDFPTTPQHLGYTAHAHHWLGNVLMKTNRLDEAEQQLRESLALRERIAAAQPDSPDNQSHLSHIKAYMGYLLRRRDKPLEAEHFYRDAITIMEKVVADFPSGSEFFRRLASYHGSLGRLLKETGRTEEAELALRRRLAVEQKMLADFPDLLIREPAYLGAAHYDLALLYDTTERPGEATEHFRKAMDAFEQGAAAFPDAAGPLSKLAWFLSSCPARQFRDPQRAVTLAKKALQYEPLSTVYWYILGVAEYRAGNWDAAIEATQRAIKLRPDGGDSTHWFVLAMANWRLERKDEADKWHRQAVQWMDNNASHDEQLSRLRAEAKELMGIDRQKGSDKTQESEVSPEGAPDNSEPSATRH